MSEFQVYFETMTPGAHNVKRASPILGLFHGDFTDRFIFRYILGHLHSVYELWVYSKYKKIWNFFKILKY